MSYCLHCTLDEQPPRPFKWGYSSKIHMIHIYIYYPWGYLQYMAIWSNSIHIWSISSLLEVPPMPWFIQGWWIRWGGHFKAQHGQSLCAGIFHWQTEIDDWKGDIWVNLTSSGNIRVNYFDLPSEPSWRTWKYWPSLINLGCLRSICIYTWLIYMSFWTTHDAFPHWMATRMNH
jgi:hypothetical protein